MRERLGSEYWREDTRVFFGSQRVPTHTPPSFRFLGGSWARDEDSIFVAGRPLKAADPDSFRVLNQLFALDKVSAWFLGGRVREADPATFEVLDLGVRYSGPGAYPYSFSGYARDARSVFHYDLTVGKPCLVRGANNQAFQSINGVFGRDGSAIFIDRRRLNYADAATWLPLGGLYSRDSHFAYYDNRRIIGADPDSLICLPGRQPVWAKDDRRFYDIGAPSSREAYLEELALAIESHRRLVLRISGDEVACQIRRIWPA